MATSTDLINLTCQDNCKNFSICLDSLKGSIIQPLFCKEFKDVNSKQTTIDKKDLSRKIYYRLRKLDFSYFQTNRADIENTIYDVLMENLN